jgi:hypothetical protein
MVVGFEPGARKLRIDAAGNCTFHVVFAATAMGTLNAAENEHLPGR